MLEIKIPKGFVLLSARFGRGHKTMAWMCRGIRLPNVSFLSAV